MLLLVAYGQRDPNAYYLTHHIRQSFSNGISETLNHKDIFIWANSALLRNLYGQYPGNLSICVVYSLVLPKPRTRIMHKAGGSFNKKK